MLYNRSVIHYLTTFFLRCLLPVLLLASTAGCREPVRQNSAEEQSVEPASPAQERPAGRGFVFDCIDAGFRFSTWIESDSMGLWLPLSFERPYVKLGLVPSADGARFEGDGVAVWTHEREATLEVDGRSYSPCAMDWLASIWEDAKLRGVAFRAVGNEPGWLLEITNGERIRLLLDYGERELVVPDPGHVTDQEDRRTVYHVVTDSFEVTVTIEGAHCADTMSEETFESTVTIDVDDRTYRGCGRALF